MRNAFAQEIERLAELDDRIVLLSGDIGNKMYDKYKEKFPDRFYNCGVAEANMTGVAAGMALSGLRPFTYTITTFNTQRCFEQIRLDAGYHKAPVVIVGVGGGLSYASLGPTHHANEDIALMRVIPPMTVICPADPVEVRLAVRATLDLDGPAYIRLGKKGEPTLHKTEPNFEIGKAIVMREGDDACLLGVGTMLANSLAAADLLAEQGISCRVVSFHCAKPLDTSMLMDAFMAYPLVVSIEEHSLIGGVGAAVAEWCADNLTAGARLLRLGIPDELICFAGSQKYVRARIGLDPESIAERVRVSLQSTN